MMNIGIIGAGRIGKVHCESIMCYVKNATVKTVADPFMNSDTEKWLKDMGVEKVTKDYRDIINDKDIDAVLICSSTDTHAPISIEAIKAGKHVFCEKSITVNASQLQECAALAAEKNLVICDGVTLFHMPLYKELKKRIASGAIGQVKMVQVNFGSCKEYDVNNRFFSKELAGGALLDIGVYAVSFARYFMGSKANVVLTTANYSETGVDETSGILLKNPDGEMAVISLTMRAKQPKRGVIAGEKGYIEINNYPRADKATITYTEDGRTETIEIGSTAKALQYEVEDMQDYVQNRTGQANFQYVCDVTDTLTAIRSQWGMVYPFE